jgi:hypothetical protein
MSRFQLQVVARLHQPNEKDSFNPARKNILFEDCRRWLHALTRIGKESDIPCAASLNPGEERNIRYADILVDAHHRLQPDALKKMADWEQANRFGIYLILTYEEVPKADWLQGASLPFVRAEKNAAGIYVPDEHSVEQSTNRIRCKSMSSFGEKEMKDLLEDAITLPITRN